MDGIKSWALSDTGDLVIEHNAIQMVDGNELLRQKIQEVLQTNKGEWFLDWEQGIEFSQILGKGVTEDAVRAQIKDGLQQVDEALSLSEFSMTTEGRTLRVNFTATNDITNEKISVSTEY